MLASNPLNAALNFKDRVIELKFDEYVQVKDISNQLVVTPQTKEMPLVEAVGKRITIKFNEELSPNTTYRLFFGNAIADMHESNVLSNFEFVFSTGSVIDSLFVAGEVKNAFNLNPQTEVMVGLYGSEESDSVVFKRKPMYFSKTAENGSYKLTYLPNATFKTFAFTDKNKNLMYDGGEELVAFSDKTIETGKDSIIHFKTFKEEPLKVFLKKAISPYYGMAQVIFNREQANLISAYYKNQENDISSVNNINDTCKIYYKNIFDTLKLLIYHPDRKITDTVSILVSSKERFERLKTEKKHVLSMDLKPIESGRMDYFANPVLVFNNWIDDKSIDQSKMMIQYKTDSLVKTALQLNKQTNTGFTVGNKLMPGISYDIIFKKGAFKSMTGIESDSIKFSFKTSEASDHAALNAKLMLPKKENYIVQLVNDKEIVVAEQYIEMSMTSSADQALKFKNLAPGNYFLKIIEDKNQNKKWDTGNILLKKQPETIYFNALSIKLLADWDSETEWKVE